MADKKPILPTPAEKGVKRGGADGDSSMLSSSPPRHSHDNGRGEGGRDGKHGKDGAKGEGHKPRRNSFDADHGVFAPAKAVGRRNQRTDKTVSLCGMHLFVCDEPHSMSSKLRGTAAGGRQGVGVEWAVHERSTDRLVEVAVALCERACCAILGN